FNSLTSKNSGAQNTTPGDMSPASSYESSEVELITISSSDSENEIVNDGQMETNEVFPQERQHPADVGEAAGGSDVVQVNSPIPMDEEIQDSSKGDGNNLDMNLGVAPVPNDAGFPEAAANSLRVTSPVSDFEEISNFPGPTRHNIRLTSPI